MRGRPRPDIQLTFL